MFVLITCISNFSFLFKRVGFRELQKEHFEEIASGYVAFCL